MAVLRLKPEAVVETTYTQDRESLTHVVWRLAWPALGMNALQTINLFIDRGFIGKYIGRDALAAVGVSANLLFLLIAFAFALSTGTTAIVARAYGARDLNEAREATKQSLALSILLGILGSAIAFALIQPYAHWMRLEKGTEHDTILFLTVTTFGIAPLFVLNTLAGAFRGIGDTLRPMLIMIAVNLTHLTGDVLLIFGHAGLPKLGLTGAAIALTLSQFVGMALYIIVFSRYGLKGALKLQWPDTEWAKRILRISLPASVQSLLRISGMMAFSKILALTPDRTIALAALPIGISAESIAFMPGLGYSVAAAALVGQNLGAKQPDRAERLGWAASWQCCALMTVMSATFFLFAAPLAGLFTKDPPVIKVAANYLRIMAVSEPLLAFSMVLAGALQGAGDTVRPTIATFLATWIARVPLTYLWAIILMHGTIGAWYGMSVSQALGGFFMIMLFRGGQWKRTKV